MRSGITLFRLFGIDIRVDPSWVFIFLLLTFSLASGVFPMWHPEWGPGLRWGVAIAATLLFFASVLLHELAHSLVAKAKGLPVRRITLFLFGGVSNIEREPSSPGTEFLMAIVGPITSLVLGFFFLLIGSALAGFGAQTVPSVEMFARVGPLATLLLWLGPVNIAVGLFNMIPGFPLDGGRVLRSALWGATKDLRKATRWASAVGQIVGWGFILMGIAMIFGARFPVFGGGFINGMWIAFIGWFLNNAAVASAQQVIIEDLLEEIPVAQLMKSDVASVPVTATVGDLVNDWLLRTDERAFPVVDGDRLAGLVCMEDVRKVPREQWNTTTVGTIMTPAQRLAIVSPNEDSSEAVKRLIQRDVRQVPVVENGHIVGMLRRRDVLRWLQLHSDLKIA